MRLPDNLANKVKLKLPEGGLDIESPQAVLLKTDEQEGATESTLIFGPTRDVVICWRPQVRRTEQEEAVFFCEMNTFALFESGVANMTHLLRYQVAQGEVQSLQFPRGFSRLRRLP